MLPDETRPDPEALLIAAAREGKGRLKVFLGAAPGVGKTWEMLNAARRRRAEGVDVVVGVVETHGRAETEAQVGDLPVLPRLSVAYRGQTLEEFDLDAALRRRPGLLLVDELAHTNAPGSRHHKRWEDVAELLEAGLDVWATLNAQHFESLNETVARITGVRVSETLPDRVLEMADEIEFIDLSPAELRARLREGRVYRPDMARRALEGFFREGNLAALREIALRLAAQRVDRDVRDYMRQKAIPGPWPAADRVLALVGSDASSDAVVRHAKRLADALHAPWIALHVERPGGTDTSRPALEIAAQLGADVQMRAGADLVRTTLELAAASNATHIVIGRARSSLWRRLLGRTFAATLLRQGSDFALHVIPLAGPAGARRAARRRIPRDWLPWMAATLLVAAVIGAGELFHPWLEHEALGMLFLAAVVGTATLYGLVVALYAAALGFVSWNFLFIPPLYALTIYEPRDVIAVFVFAGVATASGWLGSRVRAEARAAQGRIENLRRISAFTRKLGEPPAEPDLLDEIARQGAAIAGLAAVLMARGEDLDIRAAAPASVDTMDAGSWAAARWAWTRGEPAGRGTATLPSSAWRFLPMRTARGLLGILGVRTQAPLEAPQLQALGALADQAAAAIERVRLASEAARSEAQAETQKLRTALLNSLSHDLRTPLTSIRGSAGLLRTAWGTLSAEARVDLLASIEQDTVRMTGFLADIMEMTRLESGEIVPRRERVRLAEIAEAAIARLGGTAPVAVHLPDSVPDALADPQLLEQVLVNLLENAVKYSPDGAPVRVGAERADGSVCLTIADDGVGIPPADLPHVFDSFYRARHEDRTRPGTGLGLAIARGLCEAMGGTIAAQSPRPDRARDAAPGTVLRVCLPALTQAEPS
ncbi:MAG: sensor histidine kinase KdpD [Acidisphaera sp.]|nr:sensor histidine kinase KdpD [Acidisphaera sp.]